MSKFVRDARSPMPRSETISKVMSANRGRDTRPERILRSALYASGLRGYRLHRTDIPGRPDISFGRKKLAVFVNGCFWHRCPECRLPLPREHRAFWEEKFERNVERDGRKMTTLTEAGWRVVVIWEHEIRDDLPGCVDRVRAALERP